jgi:hypothetical protein
VGVSDELVSEFVSLLRGKIQGNILIRTDSSLFYSANRRILLASSWDFPRRANTEILQSNREILGRTRERFGFVIGALVLGQSPYLIEGEPVPLARGCFTIGHRLE